MVWFRAGVHTHHCVKPEQDRGPGDGVASMADRSLSIPAAKLASALTAFGLPQK